MYIKTLKLRKPIVITALLTVAAALVLIAALIAVHFGGGERVYRVQTEQQRQALISELGWETAGEPTEHKNITVPDEFDDVYKGYNELQKAQGFDLEDYKGQKAEVYTYPVYNYPGHEDCMQITLIGCGGMLIGGDVCCTELDGFMQGLLMDKKSMES